MPSFHCSRLRFQRRLAGLLQTYSTQLALGLSLLIVAATLSAGLPAYWLTHMQLNQQVALHLRDAQQATLSLLQTEQHRLANVATVFAERPTLAALLDAPQDASASGALDAYITNFKAQIDLDLLLLCTADGRILGGSLPLRSCPEVEGFLWVNGQPVLAARRTIQTEVGSRVVAGIRLDDGFLRQLAAGTGVEQTLLGLGGTRLAGSLDEGDWRQTVAPLSPPLDTEMASATPATVQIGSMRHFQSIAPLTDANGQTVFYSEILLPADELLATSNRVRTFLLTSTALIALLGAALGAWSIRRLTSPLASLTTVAERISQGEFETPIPDYDGPVEVQTLTAALQRSQASIVQALGERAAAADRLDNLVQSLVEGVVIIDSSGRITFWNEGAALLTGWPASAARGKPLDRVLPQIEATQPPLIYALPPAGQRQRFTVLTSGGKATVLEVTSVRSTRPMTAQAQKNERALVMRDVTEEEAMLRLRSYFLANISHEFRTPLSTLNASIELLMDEQQKFSGAEMRTLLKPIHLSLLELQTLIDNLLEGSTIEAGEFRLRKRVMSIDEAISAARMVVQPMLERRRQQIHFVESETPREIFADRVRLSQILVNLLANASKYTPLGETIDLAVELRAGDGSKDDGAGEASYRVMVADRGPGIPEAERVNLFRRFVRLESSRNESVASQTTDVYGTGIGLYVVKTTVEAHGGRVGIEDRPGGGAVFWFELPRGEAETQRRGEERGESGGMPSA